VEVAFVGKGGSGKTALAALFTRTPATDLSTALFAFDADINQHLAAARPRTRVSCSRRWATTTYIKGQLGEVAAALAAMTGMSHPLARPTSA
jgi:hypothetical protein